LPRRRVLHIEDRPEWQRPMRRRQQHRIENLPIRRRPPRELFSVPARDAAHRLGHLGLGSGGGGGARICDKDDQSGDRRAESGEPLRKPSLLSPLPSPLWRHTLTSPASARISLRSLNRMGSTSSIRNRSVCCFASPV